MHGKKKGELSQGHTGASYGALSPHCSSKLRKLQKTGKEKSERTEKGFTWELEGRTKRRKPYLVL